VIKWITFLFLISNNCAFQKPTPEDKEEFCRTQLLQNLVLGEISSTIYKNNSGLIYTDCILKKNNTKGKTILEYDGGRFIY
jgi:hypothetical protein